MITPNTMNILLINHKFPPDQGVATFRVAKFAKYLTEFGCDVHVLTMNNGHSEVTKLPEEDSIVKSITRVNPLSDWVPIVKTSVNRWIPPMIRRAIKLINYKNIDVVLHSAPPRIPLTGCLPIKHLTDTPYIIDLRDPFYTENVGTTGDWSEKSKSNSTYYKILKFLEPRVLNCASRIILNNEQMREIYSTKYPVSADKMEVVHNGFDPDDFSGVEPRHNENFQIVFPGKFRDDMRWFLRPFSKFVKKRKDVIFTHYGRIDYGKAPEVKSVVDELKLMNHVEFEGYVDKKEVLGTAMSADIGLAVSRPGDRTHVPTKVYDYIGCNIPILGVDDGSSGMRNLLKSFQNGHILNRYEEEAIYSTLVSLYNNAPLKLDDKQLASKYTRRNLTKQLHGILKETVE